MFGEDESLVVFSLWLVVVIRKSSVLLVVVRYTLLHVITYD